MLHSPSKSTQIMTNLKKKSKSVMTIKTTFGADSGIETRIKDRKTLAIRESLSIIMSLFCNRFFKN